MISVSIDKTNMPVFKFKPNLNINTIIQTLYLMKGSILYEDFYNHLITVLPPKDMGEVDMYLAELETAHKQMSTTLFIESALQPMINPVVQLPRGLQ